MLPIDFNASREVLDANKGLIGLSVLYVTIETLGTALTAEPGQYVRFFGKDFVLAVVCIFIVYFLSSAVLRTYRDIIRSRRSDIALGPTGLNSLADFKPPQVSQQFHPPTDTSSSLKMAELARDKKLVNLDRVNMFLCHIQFFVEVFAPVLVGLLILLYHLFYR